MFILPHGTWKDINRSVILDWRKRSAGCSSKEERSAGLSREGRVPLVTQAKGRGPPVSQAKGKTCGSLKQTCNVCFSVVVLIHTKGLRDRRKICANCLWLYSYFIHVTVEERKYKLYVYISTSPLLLIQRCEMQL